VAKGLLEKLINHIKIMFIKNNSKKEWKQYNVGRGIIVDIKPGAIIEIENQAGRKLLSLLGAPKWLTECEAPIKKKEVTPIKVTPIKKKIKKENYEKNNK